MYFLMFSRCFYAFVAGVVKPHCRDCLHISPDGGWMRIKLLISNVQHFFKVSVCIHYRVGFISLNRFSLVNKISAQFRKEKLGFNYSRNFRRVGLLWAPYVSFFQSKSERHLFYRSVSSQQLFLIPYNPNWSYLLVFSMCCLVAVLSYYSCCLVVSFAYIYIFIDAQFYFASLSLLIVLSVFPPQKRWSRP